MMAIELAGPLAEGALWGLQQLYEKAKDSQFMYHLEGYDKDSRLLVPCGHAISEAELKKIQKVAKQSIAGVKERCPQPECGQVIMAHVPTHPFRNSVRKVIDFTTEEALEDWTHRAKEGRIQAAVGRTREIHQLIQVLCRQTKNNPLLIGEPGVGKTALVEGLACLIARDEVPDVLKNRRIVALNVGSLISGTKLRGDLEKKMEAILKRVKASAGNMILFIDEIHTLVGSNSGDTGGIGLTDQLKPALARGELHCIGATTQYEYQKYFEKDPAFERRFQRISVEEPSFAATVEILRSLAQKYEEQHAVFVQDSAIQAAVKLSERFIPDRRLPDKAKDLLDEAASQVQMQISGIPYALRQLEEDLLLLKQEKERLAHESNSLTKLTLSEIEQQIALKEKERDKLQKDWDRSDGIWKQLQRARHEAKTIKIKLKIARERGEFSDMIDLSLDQLPSVEKEIDLLLKQLRAIHNPAICREIDGDLIAQLIEKWTGIPIGKLQEDEAKKLLNFKQDLSKAVIGQAHAIEIIYRAIIRTRTGLSEPNRPNGVFLFLGKTGVGKTELAKALAKQLFGDTKALIRIDMSEYMEVASLSRLIGSPPGYAGYDEPGQLTEALRKRPYSVVLLDEVEKAHRSLLNLFLQVFDDGRITDSHGRIADARNALFIMTSNVGAQQVESVNDTTSYLTTIEPALKQAFNPEFLNRMDALIPFFSLQKEEIKRIAALQLKHFQEHIKEKQLIITWDDQLLNYLADKGYNPQMGARPLKRVIDDKIKTLLAEALLTGQVQPGSTICLTLSRDEPIIQQR